MRILTNSLCIPIHCRIERLRRRGAKTRRQIRRRLVMADVVYLAVGVLFFALMGLYAVACDRL